MHYASQELSVPALQLTACAARLKENVVEVNGKLSILQEGIGRFQKLKAIDMSMYVSVLLRTVCLYV